MNCEIWSAVMPQRKNIKLTQASATIITAIIGILGTIIGGYFVIQAAILPIKLEVSTTQTAEAKSNPSEPSLTLSSPTGSNSTDLLIQPTPHFVIRGQSLTNDCIADWNGFGYDPTNSYAQSMTFDDKGCSQLQGVGISAQDNGLLLFSDGNFEVLGSGIATELKEKYSDVSFDLAIQQLEIQSEIPSFVAFGISNNPSYNLGTPSLYFYAESPLPSIKYGLGTIDQVTGQKDISDVQSLTKNSNYHITFSLKGVDLTIYVNNKQLGSPLIITETDPVFWIYRFTTKSAKFRAFISNFTINGVP